MAQKHDNTEQHTRNSIMRVLSKSKNTAVAIDALIQLIDDEDNLKESTQEQVEAVRELSQAHKAALIDFQIQLNDFLNQEQKD